MRRIIPKTLTKTLDAASSAMTTAQTGKQSMSRMKEQMQSISADSDEMVAMVNVLNNYSQEIGGALHTVNDFASQTKPLALNASIEAAQAGEHGKGEEISAGSEEAAASVNTISQISTGVSDHSDEIYRRLTQEQKDLFQEVARTSVLLEQQTNEMSAAVRKVKV